MSAARRLAICMLAAVTLAVACSGQDAGVSALAPIALDDALRRAAETNKFVLAVFHTSWDVASGEMERTTWRAPRIMREVEANAVAIRIDAEANPELSDRYSIESLPTAVFIRANGDAFDRVVGYRNAAQFETEFSDVRAGKDAVQRAREYSAKAADRNPVLRERLAEALAAAGKPDEALVEYLWCFDEALKVNIPYAVTRRQPLAVNIGRLAKRHPPALQALRDRRDARANALLSGDDRADAARDLAAIDEALEARAATLALYDRLPPDARGRTVLFSAVFEELIDARRYAEVLARSAPLEEFTEIVRVARAQKTPCCAVHFRGGRFVGETVVSRGAKLVEALAGGGREVDAQTLIDAVLAYQDTPEHRALLANHLRRAGADELARTLELRP